MPRARAPAPAEAGGERPRRLRSSPAIRGLVAETDVRPSRLVMPLFVASHPSAAPPGLPALGRRTAEATAVEAGRLAKAGVRNVLLFGIPDRKSPDGRAAWDPKGPVPSAIRAIKASHPDVGVLADVCLCEYTDHGHCGVVVDGTVDNDRTLPLLARTAVTYAGAGADLVAPSAMMDHQVAAIREGLDEAGRTGVGIVAYAAKYASSFYGPFRDAAGSAPSFGDRRTYQMDPRNRREALRELRLDAAEGADVLLVKPALPCLDIIAEARATFDLPIAAYQVSGEYAMLRAAADAGRLREADAVAETLGAIRRAGADFVVSYFAGSYVPGPDGGP